MGRRALGLGCAIVALGCAPTVDEASDESASGGSDDGVAAAPECWIWEAGFDSAILGIAPLLDGGLAAVGMEGNRPRITRLDANGIELWSIAPPVTAGYYRSVMVLPSGELVALGNTVVSNTEIGDVLLHAFADDGTLLWMSDDATTLAKSLSSGVWWNGGEAIVAIADLQDAPGEQLAVFDAEGTLVTTMDPFGGASLMGLTAFGDGYASCGVLFQAPTWRWHVSTHDASGAARWSAVGDVVGGWSGCAIVGDGVDRVVWVGAQVTGDNTVTVSSLRDGAVEWSTAVGAAARAGDIAIADDGTAFVVGTEYENAWVRTFSREGADELMLASNDARGRFEAASLWSNARLYHAGFDEHDGQVRGFVGCLDLTE